MYRGEWRDSKMAGCGVKISKKRGKLIAEEGFFTDDEWAGDVMACSVKQARAAAAEADVAAEMARHFELDAGSKAAAQPLFSSTTLSAAGAMSAGAAGRGGSRGAGAGASRSPGPGPVARAEPAGRGTAGGAPAAGGPVRRAAGAVGAAAGAVGGAGFRAIGALLGGAYQGGVEVGRRILG